MGLITKAFGARLPSADFNAVARQVVITCTSGTRPVSPDVGMTIFETDTFRLLMWNGHAWTPPWNQPWGMIGRKEVSTDQTGIGTGSVDVTGASVAFTAVANRRYRILVRAQLQSGAGTAAIANLKVTKAGGTLVGVLFNDNGSTTPGVIHTTSDWVEDEPGAGAVTYQVAVQFSVNSDNSVNGATVPTVITVEDVGPSGATGPSDPPA